MAIKIKTALERDLKVMGESGTEVGHEALIALARTLAVSLDKEVTMGLAGRFQEALRDLGIGRVETETKTNVFDALKDAMANA